MHSHELNAVDVITVVNKTVTSQEEGKDWRIKEISSSVNRKLAINLMHSSKPAKTVYSPPKGFFRKYRSNLWQTTNTWKKLAH